MIDLTLDSIKIPDIAGYTPPFGTKISRTVSNKGGLSTRDVNNNIIDAFGKMRGIAVSISDQTTRIEYDAKLYINAESAITLTLGNGHYAGCIVTIINLTNIKHSVSCSLNNLSSFYLDSLKTIELIWNGTYWQNTNAPAIGKIVEQFPQEKSPDEIYPGTLWSEINYNGAFFRTYKQDVSEDFIEEGDSLVCQDFDNSATGLSFNGTKKNTENQPTSQNPKTESFTYSHTHDVLALKVTKSGGVTNGAVMMGREVGLYASATSSSNDVIADASVASGTHTHDYTLSGTINSSSLETRPINYTMKLWKRIF